MSQTMTFTEDEVGDVDQMLFDVGLNAMFPVGDELVGLYEYNRSDAFSETIWKICKR